MEELYKLYFKEIYRYMLAMTKDEHMAEEITQETLFKAIQKFVHRCKYRTEFCG